MIWMSLAGCFLLEGGDNPPLVAGQPCLEEGYLTPTTADMTLFQFDVDGVSLLVDFVPGAVYDGEPAACFNSETGAALLTVEVEGEAYATLLMRPTSTGSLDLNSPASGQLTFDLFGAQPPATYGVGRWLEGTWFVNSTIPLDADLSGTAVGADVARDLLLDLSLSVSP
jgi:hypothetical protein